MATGAPSSTSERRQAAEEAPHQDLIERARVENRAAVECELLPRSIALTPRDSERVVIGLLRRWQRAHVNIEHSGKPGDGGIDGIFSQDPLGLDRIYVQAKKYSPGDVVGRPTNQRFVGALQRRPRTQFLDGTAISRIFAGA